MWVAAAALVLPATASASGGKALAAGLANREVALVSKRLARLAVSVGKTLPLVKQLRHDHDVANTINEKLYRQARETLRHRALVAALTNGMKPLLRTKDRRLPSWERALMAEVTTLRQGVRGLISRAKASERYELADALIRWTPIFDALEADAGMLDDTWRAAVADVTAAELAGDDTLATLKVPVTSYEIPRTLPGGPDSDGRRPYEPAPSQVEDMEGRF